MYSHYHSTGTLGVLPKGCMASETKLFRYKEGDIFWWYMENMDDNYLSTCLIFDHHTQDKEVENIIVFCLEKKNTMFGSSKGFILLFEKLFIYLCIQVRAQWKKREDIDQM